MPRKHQFLRDSLFTNLQLAIDGGSMFNVSPIFCCNVTSSKRRHKNSMKCAIAKFLNQDVRPDRYWKLKRMMENSAKVPPHTQPEREHIATAKLLFLDLGGM